MCQVVKCASEGCEAKVMAENGYCTWHGGKKQYLKDKRAGKFNKPAATQPVTPAKPNGQTDNNPRFADLRKKQKIGAPGHGLGGLSKIDGQRYKGFSAK